MENKPKRKILKCILLAILAIVIIFAVSTIRKMIIISNLNNKASLYENSTNYHIKQSQYVGYALNEFEWYIKDSSIIRVMATTSQDSTVFIKQYHDGTKTNTYVETSLGKFVTLNTSEIPTKRMNVGYLYVDSIYELFLLSLSTSSIKNESCNGKDCYSITMNLNEKGFYPNGILFGGEGIKIYFEKETGLPIREITINSYNCTVDEVADNIYEFDTVTEDDFIEPDINEYTVAQ